MCRIDVNLIQWVSEVCQGEKVGLDGFICQRLVGSTTKPQIHETTEATTDSSIISSSYKIKTTTPENEYYVTGTMLQYPNIIRVI